MVGSDRAQKRAFLQAHEEVVVNVDHNGDDETDLDSEHCSFSLLDSDEDELQGTEDDASGSRPGTDCTAMSSSLTDVIVSSPSSAESMDECLINKSAGLQMTNNTLDASQTAVVKRPKCDRRTAKQLTERKRRDRINSLLDTLRTLILRLLRKNPRHHRKLEKADILELVVSFLKRELQKNHQRHRQSADTNSVLPRDLTQYPPATISDYTPPLPGSVFAPDAFHSPSCIPVGYQPIACDPYLNGVTIPIPSISSGAYLFPPDFGSNEFPHPNSCPVGSYQFKSPPTGMLTTLPDQTVSGSIVTPRRPLGSIENLNRTSGSSLPSISIAHARPVSKDGKQPMKLLGSMNGCWVPSTHMNTPPCSSVLSASVYNERPVTDENHGIYANLQTLLGSATTTSHTLWRPYV